MAVKCKAGVFGRAFTFIALILLACHACSAQTYSNGQIVSPAYEGWQKNADGSYSLIFGYMNANWEEELDVPIGPDNNFEPGGADQGQPTHFFPRRNRFIFRVRVPADFGDKEIVWTLKTHGQTVRAYGTLKQDYFVDDMVFTSETGAIGAGVSNPAIRANKPPVIDGAEPFVRTAKTGEPLTLTAHVTDDGVPKPRDRTQDDSRRAAALGVTDLRMLPPRQITVGSSTGIWVACYLYRGPAKVSFAPDQVKTWEDTRAGANSQWAPRWVAPRAPADGKWTVQATFSEPGSYVLRWHASDGALWADEEITVNVTP